MSSSSYKRLDTLCSVCDEPKKTKSSFVWTNGGLTGGKIRLAWEERRETNNKISKKKNLTVFL